MKFEEIQYLIGISISLLLMLLLFFLVLFFYLKKSKTTESYTDKLGKDAETKVNNLVQI
jgi:Zn-dependent protease with chaperone function